MKPVAVFDIDGVLADVRHRVHHVQSRPKNWHAFFAAAGRDGLLRPGADLVRSLLETHEVRYLTGRPERLRKVTVAWIARHGLPSGELVMRPNRDFRPSKVFKRDHLLSWLDDGAVIDLVVDDDPQVVAMLHELELPVVQATWQDGTDAGQQSLWRAQEDLGRT